MTIISGEPRENMLNTNNYTVATSINLIKFLNFRFCILIAAYETLTQCTICFQAECAMRLMRTNFGYEFQMQSTNERMQNETE